MEKIKCKRCGRVLTNPKSIELGYGDKCYRIMNLHGDLGFWKRFKNSIKHLGKTKRNNESIEYRIINSQNAQITRPNTDITEDLLDRVRKLELDNNFMKHQLKHKTIVIGQNVESIERIKQDHHRPERNIMKVQFNIIVKELKVIFPEDPNDFHYTDILKPIDVREQPESPPEVFELLN